MNAGAGPPPDPRHTEWMGAAIDEAWAAGSVGDVPVGAVVVSADDEIIGMGRNRREVDADPTAHAEIIALRGAASSSGTWRLTGCTLVVTLEPCLMCAGAALAARVDRIVLGAWDDKAGATGSVWDVVRDRRANHWIEVVAGVRAEESARLLTDFFSRRR